MAGQAFLALSLVLLLSASFGDIGMATLIPTESTALYDLCRAFFPNGTGNVGSLTNWNCTTVVGPQSGCSWTGLTCTNGATQQLTSMYVLRPVNGPRTDHQDRGGNILNCFIMESWSVACSFEVVVEVTHVRGRARRSSLPTFRSHRGRSSSSLILVLRCSYITSESISGQLPTSIGSFPLLTTLCEEFALAHATPKGCADALM